jgi:hypothetical protein
MVVTGVLGVVDSKTTFLMLHQFAPFLSGPIPLGFSTSSNEERPFSLQLCISQCTPRVLHFFTKIIILHRHPNWISAQGIDIGMPDTWTVYNPKVEVLQKVNPPTPPAMCV